MLHTPHAHPDTCASASLGGHKGVLGYGRAVHGHMDLVFKSRSADKPDHADVTYLADQTFSAPIHLSKTHHDQDALVVHLVNPTAGWFDGDTLKTRVRLEAGARVTLSTPSASRVHRARNPEACAHLEQSFSVASGAMLEWIPDAFIPQASARYQQTTSIHLERDASLLFFDWITPGRVARGEVFAYTNLAFSSDLWQENKLIARERFALNPNTQSLEALKQLYPAAHIISLFAVGIPQENWPTIGFEALAAPHTYLGHGPLCGENAFVVRVLCADSLAARSTLNQLRNLMYSALARHAPSLGKW